MTQLYANPYDTSASGFYFESAEEFRTKYEEHLPTEEYSIEFIDGELEDAELFEAADITAANLDTWFDTLEPMETYDKAGIFFLCGTLGYNLDEALRKQDDVTLYHGPLEEAARELFDDCYANEIPKSLRNYIDYDAFARDCEVGGDMTEFDFGGETWTCTNASCI